MVLVFLKNLFFPRSSRESRPRHSRSASQSPLLPTYSSSSPKPKDVRLCTHPGCPNRPTSRCSNSSDSSGSTAGGGGGGSGGGGGGSGERSRWLDPRTVSDAIIGLSDGLTVPFALTAGLSAFNDTDVVLYGGFAELIAGSISMGLGGWLAGRGEAAYYNTTLASTQKLVYSAPTTLPSLLTSVFAPYGLSPSSLAPLVNELLSSPTSAIDFLMCFHHQLPPPSSKRTPLSSALTIAAGYFLGGFVPLLPYFFVGKQEVMKGLYCSVGVMAVCLFAFGVAKTWVLVDSEGDEEEVEVEGQGGRRGKGVGEKVRGGLEMVAVGGVAAGVSWAVIRALDRGG